KDKSAAAIWFTPRAGKPKSLAKLVEGENSVELAGVGDGNHTLYVKCDGYAAQYISVKIEDGQLAKDSASVTLYHRRYVTVGYAFNTKGGRQLSGDGVIIGRVALTHWTAPPRFGEDWQLVQ